MLVASVLPDVPAIARPFDYLVPPALAPALAVGALVRVDLHGRRVRGWVVGLEEGDGAGRATKALARVTGRGPAPEVVDLASWAAWRWAGRAVHLLRTASPPVAVRALPPPAPPAAAAGPAGEVRPAGEAGGLAVAALARVRAVLRLPPAADPLPLALAAAGRAAAAGPGASALVLVPSVAGASALAAGLRRAGVAVALLPGEWARAAAGGAVVVGTRAAAWGPAPGLAAAVVLDEHDAAWQQEQAPTWHSRDVVAERARRAGAACVLASPCPSLEALAWGPLLAPSRAAEREGWAPLEVLDRRRQDPADGLWPPRLVALARSGARMVCVLNRKGRARLLACAGCRELARCAACGSAVEQAGAGAASGLRCRRCGAERPVVCAACGATRLRVLRPGVSRAREDLEALAGETVAEVTADSDPAAGARLVVGTEAALHRVAAADVVAFVDFDQELLAPRYRAGEEALALLARASRLVGGRGGGGRVVVATSLPGHDVVAAALHADPSRVAVAESAARTALRLPPEVAMAVVSGEGAGAFADALAAGGHAGVELVGPAGGRWMVRASDHAALCSALAATPRPAGRLRVEVDPRHL